MLEEVIIALDGMTEEEALALARKLRGKVWGFKVNDLLLDSGLEIIKKLKNFGAVFADPKLYDIPNTVANSMRKLESVGADLVTLHATGGHRMLTQAVSNVAHTKLLAVTLLTSFNEDDAQKIYGKSANDTVVSLARMALEAGVHGVVCSPNELKLLQNDPQLRTLIKVTPGIRPAWHQKADDQSRVMTPKEALAAGADLLVIGRPVTGHADPLEAIALLEQELA